MNPDLPMVECEYRTNHNTVSLTISHIESIAEVKGGSNVRMTSGTVHEVLNTHEEIKRKISGLPW